MSVTRHTLEAGAVSQSEGLVANTSTLMNKKMRAQMIYSRELPRYTTNERNGPIPILSSSGRSSRREQLQISIYESSRSNKSRFQIWHQQEEDEAEEVVVRLTILDGEVVRAGLDRLE